MKKTSNKIDNFNANIDAPRETTSRFLNFILSSFQLKNVQSGAIFVPEEQSNIFVLDTSIDLNAEQMELCTRKSYIRFLRGEVALNRDIQFTPCVDKNQDICFTGIPPHGFFIVPIVDGKNILGLVVLYIEQGYEPKGIEFEFLNDVSSALAVLLARNKAKNTNETARVELTYYKQALDEHSIVAVTDTSGQILSVNDKFCEVSKFTKDELIGQDHRILNSNYHPKSFFADIYKTIANGQAWHGEIKNRAKDGSIYWLNSTIAPIKNNSGKIVQYISIRTDITHSKIAEAELKRNADILNTTFNNFPGGISVFTKDLVLQSANPAFFQILDLPEDLLPIGSPYEEIIRYNAERGEYGEGDINLLVAERVEIAKKFEKHAFKRAGPRGTILEIKGWPLPDGGFITTYMDVTEAENMLAALKKKSEEANRIADDLRISKEAQEQTHKHLIASVNSMQNGFVIWSAGDHLVLANDAYCGFFDPIRDTIVEGIKFEDFLWAGCNRSVWELGGPSKKEWIRQRVENRRASIKTENEFKLIDGRQILVTDMALDNGEVITTIVDITVHRERENELQNARDRLENIAFFDTLTGLANRVHCKRDLSEKLAGDNQDKRFAIIQIDLDNFKRVNDTLGHAAGDYLLKALAERMDLLSSDFNNFKSYRWGGDEFIVLVDIEDDIDLDEICEELTDLIALPLQYGASILRPTVSLGVAQYPEDAKNLEELMIFSDLALYKTKELGRDGYQFYTTKLKEKIDTETQTEIELRDAIENDQLELFFQPQLRNDDESICALEALIRWNHPEKGLIGPGQFLSIAEETGLAPAMGCKVFEYAMMAVRHWIDEGVEFGRVAVNLSPAHLKQNSILEDFFGAMEKYELDSRYLAVEFLESFIFDDPNSNILDILEQFVARDVRVELDDFGTGFASLSHLSTMPINGLKIDQSFINEMTKDRRRQGIVESLLSMAKLLDLDVVCEGIETRHQVEAIARLGKCAIQGYFIAKPMNFDAMTDWIKSKRNIGALKTQADLPLLFDKPGNGHQKILLV